MALFKNEFLNESSDGKDSQFDAITFICVKYKMVSSEIMPKASDTLSSFASVNRLLINVSFFIRGNESELILCSDK